LSNGIAHLEAMGHRVTLATGMETPWCYFAGTDDARVAGFNQMLNDPTIDLIMMARGGYGISRILHLIDWQRVGELRKPIIGFSDFTAFNLAALAKCGLISFSGPMAAIDFSDPSSADHAFMQKYLWPVLRGETITTEPFPEPLCGARYSTQEITGPIWGSNLSLLTHLVGTPYLPNIDGGILFAEEIDEQPYAIERMFLQLWHAGILQKQRAIILADFSDCEPEPGRFLYTMAHVADTLRDLVSCPVLTGLPFGHVAKKLTIPFGAVATLRIESGAFRLQY
jgi:muramoyltetrapeptide carboxypeptidase